MKVKELIEKLQKLDPESHVFVRGYESGVNDVSRVTKVKIKLNANQGLHWCGQHDVVDRKHDIVGYELIGVNK